MIINCWVFSTFGVLGFWGVLRIASEESTIRQSFPDPYTQTCLGEQPRTQGRTDSWKCFDGRAPGTVDKGVWWTSFDFTLFMIEFTWKTLKNSCQKGLTSLGIAPWYKVSHERPGSMDSIMERQAVRLCRSWENVVWNLVLLVEVLTGSSLKFFISGCQEKADSEPESCVRLNLPNVPWSWQIVIIVVFVERTFRACLHYSFLNLKAPKVASGYLLNWDAEIPRS